MANPKFKTSNLVKIIPHPDHLDHIKQHYGKTLEIDHLRDMIDHTLYKVKEIKHYAREEDLELVDNNYKED